MFNFQSLKKIKIILALINIIKYGAWCGFFSFQGQAIQQAMDSNSLMEQLVFTLIWFLATKLIVMIADVLSQFVTSYFENYEIEQQWNVHFPKKLYRDNENKNNTIYLAFFTYLPDLFTVECSIVISLCTIISVCVIVISLLIYTEFYYGVLALSAVIILNLLSKKIFLKQLNRYHTETHDNREKVLGWVNQFFRGYKEIAFNWFGQVNAWVNSVFAAYYQSKRTLIITQLKRNILSQLLVEVPFIINTSLVIIAVRLNHLSVTQMFVWVGISQFVINATNAFLEYQVNTVRKKLLINKLQVISAAFAVQLENVLPEINAFGHPMEEVAITLQDNSLNYLSLKPGIYHVQGKNGSGKSTLFNIISGYERNLKVSNHSQLLLFLQNIKTSAIRVIEREPEIFNSLKTFNQQILGYEASKLCQWEQLLEEKMSPILSCDLLYDLKKFSLALNEKFSTRVNGYLSSGEKIFISILRALTSWNATIHLLIIDECVAFLDAKAKVLFYRCLNELAVSIPIFVSSHEPLKIKAFSKNNV